MPKNVQCRRCANFRNGWCKEVVDSPDLDIVRDCDHFWTLTNGEKIRQMTDDDLCEWIGWVVQDAFLYGMGQRKEMMLFPFGDEETTFRWLKQEAEHGD